MTNDHRSLSGVLRPLRWIALLFFVMPIACAQPEGGGAQAERLPDQVLGTWVPISRGSFQYGDLVIDTETLTWATCVEEPYRVLQSRESSWLIELVRSPACPLMWAGQKALLLEVSRNGNVLNLFLSMCRDINEVEKPRPERQCNRSTFAKSID